MAIRERIQKQVDSIGDHPSLRVKAACLDRFIDCVEAIEADNDDRDATDAAVAAQIGGSAREVKHAMRGKLKCFSTDQLINMLDKMGVTVRVEFLDLE